MTDERGDSDDRRNRREDSEWTGRRYFRRRDYCPRPGGRGFWLRIGCLIPLFFLLSALGCITAGFLSFYQFGATREPPHGFLLIPIGLFLLLTLVLGWILRRLVKPLDEVMDAADRVAAGDYSGHLREQGPPQVRAFQRSFNTMTGRLQAYDEQRKRLLADISHELRTPLTVLQGNLEGMLDNVYPRDEQHIALLLEETHILSRLIDDLRTFSAAETGRLVLQKETVDPGRLVRHVADAMQPSAAKNGTQLIDQAAPGLPAADLDAARIREVLENLVSNAVRHTSYGGEIIIGCRQDPAGGKRLEFFVKDNGRGIPPDLLPHVFDRYIKSVDSGGTGLGLAVAKQLVQAHGGSIGAESEPGRGTLIRFWIPL
jgi:signal transduction histidine kinase